MSSYRAMRRFISPLPRYQVVKFPKVSGRDAEGNRVHLPVDFEGDPTLVLITFRWQQRSLARSWREFATELEERYDRFEFCELHVTGRGSGMTPPVLSGGMRPDPAPGSMDEHSILLFVDRDHFRRSLGLLGETSVYALLIDDGYVVRQAAGMVTEDIAAGLRDLLEEWDEAEQRWDVTGADETGADGEAGQ